MGIVPSPAVIIRTAADDRATEHRGAVSDNPIVVLLLINIALLLLGTFMDMAPLIITTPVLLPVARAFGIDPVHFGVVMILNAGIGLNTPSVGTVFWSIASARALIHGIGARCMAAQVLPPKTTARRSECLSAP